MGLLELQITTVLLFLWSVAMAKNGNIGSMFRALSKTAPTLSQGATGSATKPMAPGAKKCSSVPTESAFNCWGLEKLIALPVQCGRAPGTGMRAQALAGTVTVALHCQWQPHWHCQCDGRLGAGPTGTGTGSCHSSVAQPEGGRARPGPGPGPASRGCTQFGNLKKGVHGIRKLWFWGCTVKKIARLASLAAGGCT